MEGIEVNHIQASFFTKDKRFSFQDTSFSLPVNATSADLSALIKQLLESSEGELPNLQSVQFDFLINGELIRDSLDAYIQSHDLPTENVIRVEYAEQSAPPSLSEELTHPDWVSCAHCNKQFILSGCYDNSVNVWSHSGQLLNTVSEHTGAVKDVKWLTPSGVNAAEEDVLVISASQDQNINLWALSADSTLTLRYECKGHARSVEALAVSPDATKFCSVSWDTFLKIWSAVPDNGPSDELDDTEDPPSKRNKTGSNVRPLVRTPIVTFQGHSGPVSDVEWVGEGEIVTAGWDNCLRMWDVHSGENTSTLTGSKVFHDISWSRVNQLVASGNSDRLVRIWDLREKGTSMIQGTLSSHQGWVVSVNWSPVDEHQLLSGSYDSTLKLWDIRSNKLPLYTISAHEGKVLCSDWSLNRMFVSGGDDNKLRTYNI